MRGPWIRMDLLSELKREIRRATKLLDLAVKRDVPSEIEFSQLPSGRCVERRGERLLLSESKRGWLKHVLSKEALVSLMVPEVDEVPQVHDLAWVYSGAPKEVWLTCRVPPEGPFHDYDPYELLSLLPKRERLRALGTLVRILNVAAKRGTLEFPMYLALLNRVVSLNIGFSESDRKLVRIISENPAVTSDHMKRMCMGGSAISRSVRKLRTLGMLFGPENVDHWRLGLSTLVVTFPDRRECRRAFWRFPYTYNMFIPISTEVDVHTYLSYPSKGMNDLLSLKELGLDIALVKETSLMLNLDPPGDLFEAVGSALALSGESGDEPGMEGSSFPGASSPPVRVDRTDIRILNMVLEKGRVSASMLSEEGIHGAKTRLRKLRDSYIVRNYYFIGFPRGVEKTIVKVRRGIVDMAFLSKVLGSSGSAVIQHLEGESSYLIGILMVEPRVKGDLFRILRAIYGDDLIVAEDFIDVEPGWRFPVELWDEESQTFLWKDPLDMLRRELASCIGG